MSRILATLTDKPEEHIATVIQKLEHKSGYNSEDVRLLAENSHAVRAKISDLGLDPSDTTGEELYHALLAKFQKDAEVIDRSLGANESTNPHEKVGLAVEFVSHMEGVGEAWVLKASSLKSLFLKQAPLKVMHLLNYRSLASMLKHEDAVKIALIALRVESPTWKKQFDSKLAHFDSSNYELRDVKVFSINDGGWASESKEVCFSDSMLGAAGIWESHTKNKVSVLAIALALHDQMSSISSSKSSKKMSQLNPVLSWWENAEHLMAWNDGQPISLNFKDVAHAHSNSLSYKDRTKKHAAGAFWSELISRYKDKVEELPEGIAEVEQNVEKAFNPAKALAVELEGVDE